MTRRPILIAGILVAATLAGLAFHAWLYLAALDKRDAADELEALHAIADRRPPDMPWRRIVDAWSRLCQRGEIVPANDRAAYYLTRAGWARVGKPLDDDLLDLLQRIHKGTQHERSYPIGTYESAYDCDLLEPDAWPEFIAPAGRAVLAAEAAS
jgi:hypothetical protein